MLVPPPPPPPPRLQPALTNMLTWRRPGEHIAPQGAERHQHMARALRQGRPHARPAGQLGEGQQGQQPVGGGGGQQLLSPGLARADCRGVRAVGCGSPARLRGEGGAGCCWAAVLRQPPPAGRSKQTGICGNSIDRSCSLVAVAPPH
jgi:hypothetical protein